MDLIAGPYKVTRYNDQCWHILEWRTEREHRGQTVPAGYVALEIYPMTLEFAIKRIAEFVMLRSDLRVEGLAEMREALASFKRELVEEVIPHE